MSRHDCEGRHERRPRGGDRRRDDPERQGGLPRLEDPERQGGLPRLEDPEEQGGMPPLEDPEEQGGLPPLEDPERQGGVPRLEDPERQGGLPRLEDPERQGGLPRLEDPGRGHRALVDGWTRRSPRCGERRRRAPAHVGRPGAPPPTSGFVIVRLSPLLPDTGAGSLDELADELGLRALAALLAELELPSRRVVGCATAEEIRCLEREAAASDLPPLHSLTHYWRLDLRHVPEATCEVLDRLGRMAEADLAYRELAASDPAVQPSDDPYAADQGYLEAAPLGIDARWAWTQADGQGEGVAVIDLEQGWFPAHEDLVGKTPGLEHGDNRDGVGTYKGDHGTAVLGEIVGGDNALGVVGIAPGVTSVRMVSHFHADTVTSGHVAEAVVAAIGLLDPGDVLLLEVQKGFLPTELDAADFDAIRLAVAHGIVVVEAAGNGGEDLDAQVDASGASVLDRWHADFRESGALMVGASSSGVPHDRLWFSNFGSRLDCYAWGENVVSCGYGDLQAGADEETYTSTFGGTSSASPIIAGAALVVQGKYEAVTGDRLSPGQMRALLSHPATGTPQGAGTAGFIGVMPDLRRVLRDALCLTPDVYLRDRVGDDGRVTAGSPWMASPDIVVLPHRLDDAGAELGEGSPLRDAAPGGVVTAGKDHHVYLRMRNRGSTDAAGVTGEVFWSPVATLLTPDLWNRIGETRPVDVPRGDTLVVSEPLAWPADELPDPGHACFLAVLDHPTDEAPPLPPGPPHFDWAAFLAFVRGHNNVAWRNFNVVEAEGGGAVEMPFLITGTPDRPRSFDLDIVQDLPTGARLVLEVPLGLGRALARGRSLEVKAAARARRARVRLPAVRCLRFCRVRLVRGARVPARFLLESPGKVPLEGHRIAIGQLHRGQEVGRVTWEMRRRRPPI